jgi:hypothetical protein
MRTVSGHPAVTATDIRNAITKHPERLTIAVPAGKAVPKRAAAQIAIA